MLQINLLNTECDVIELADARLTYWPTLMQLNEANKFFHNLYESIHWQAETIRIAGIERLVPRLTAWYGDRGSSYVYSGIKHEPEVWNEPLLTIKAKIEQTIGVNFNSALCNLYRNGQDSVAWHADDEPELGESPVIASLSLGATRTFQLKHKTHKISHKIELTSGSLLVMQGAMQHHWLHQIPKQTSVNKPRINITFRTIK
ncbi:MAG: alpha-ketoglutarate-dependent dioxygenase AlkB [Kangiellaceae bacterium]|nr:alpha-ketoglutarate-dependent dioxygenase AlkB [Kangiellaceae bacterium]